MTELYATHQGTATIFGLTLKVYQLNNGQRIIDADDLEQFFAKMGTADGAVPDPAQIVALLNGPLDPIEEPESDV